MLGSSAANPADSKSLVEGTRECLLHTALRVRA
jgi:hypothetical protein